MSACIEIERREVSMCLSVRNWIWVWRNRELGFEVE